jgi:hypothetical protein
MEWIINIEGKKNQRIVVKFDALNENLVFIGQYKPHNKEWKDFSQIEQSIFVETLSFPRLTLVSAEKIQHQITKAYDEMEKRVKAFEEIAEAFTLLKTIEIKEEDKEE